MDYTDYYKILGVDKKASPDDIKKAYRKLARKHHPDRNQGSVKAEEKFKEINEANEVLSDPEKRSKYDELGENWRQYEQGGGRAQGFDWSQYNQQPGGGSYHFQGDPSGMFEGGDFSDFFNTLFGQARGPRQRQARGSQILKGQDYQTEMDLTLEDAFHGTSRFIQLNNNKLKISIRPGCYSGQKLRIKGKGAPGRKGGPNGDLYISVRVLKHNLYDREGDNLINHSSINIYKAILGGKISVNTFTGPIKITIPKGTQSGKRLRLRGKGMPVFGKKGKYGDMVIEVSVQIPKALNKEEEELFKKLQAIQNNKSASHARRA